MRNLSSPKIFTDLYRDLREKRLLPLIAVLLVAILAVPFLLSEPASDAGAPASAKVSSAAHGSPPTLTVSAAHPGLRDYRIRLRHDRSKNPFRQHFTAPNLAGSQLGGGGGTTTTTTTSTDAGGGGGSTTTTTTTSTGATLPEPPADGGAPQSPDEGPAKPPSSEPDQSGGEVEQGYSLTIRAGSKGDVKERELSAPAALPSENNPILVFRGLGKDGHHAVFEVSASVSAIYGDARCLKGSDRCERVAISPGSPVSFVWGPGDDVFRLLVVGIDQRH